jgi:hypothetical protein
MPIEIRMGLAIDQTVLGQKVENALALIMVMLQEQPSPWGQSPWSRRNDVTKTIKTILPTIERQAGLMVADDGLQLINDTGGNVWGIRHHESQTPPPRL